MNLPAFISRYSTALKQARDKDLFNIILRRSCGLITNFKDDYAVTFFVKEMQEKFEVRPELLNRYIYPDAKRGETNDERMIEFIESYFDPVLINEISGEPIFTKNSISYTLDEVKLKLIANAIKPTNLQQYLDLKNTNIRISKPYNPIRELFQQLAKEYNGEDVIGKLIKCLTLHKFNDIDNAEYQHFFEYAFRKWLGKVAAQALGYSQNDVMLLWVDPIGGIGKSFINKWLFSMPEMKRYFYRIQENGSYMPFEKFSVGYLALDFDELPWSQKRFDAFKSFISGEDVAVYSKKNGSFRQMNRQVNFTGSTNRANRANKHGNPTPGFIVVPDSAMMRRVLAIELDFINYQPATNGYLTLDLRQLWGQAARQIMAAYENKNFNQLSWKCDHDKLQTLNLRYVNTENKQEVQPTIEATILKHFPAANTKETASRLMTATQILSQLKTMFSNLKLNTQTLGLLLSKNNYIRIRDTTKKSKPYVWLIQ